MKKKFVLLPILFLMVLVTITLARAITIDTSSEQFPTDESVLFYSMGDNPDTSTSWIDTSQTGVNLTIAEGSPTIVNGVYDNATFFNGSNISSTVSAFGDIISTTGFYDLTYPGNSNMMIIEFNANFSDSTQLFGNNVRRDYFFSILSTSLIGFPPTLYANGVFLSVVNGTHLEVKGANLDTNYGFCDIPNVIQIGEWHHYLITLEYDGNVSLYYDGILNYTKNPSSCEKPFTTNEILNSIDNHMEVEIGGIIPNVATADIIERNANVTLDQIVVLYSPNITVLSSPAVVNVAPVLQTLQFNNSNPYSEEDVSTTITYTDADTSELQVNVEFFRKIASTERLIRNLSQTINSGDSITFNISHKYFSSGDTLIIKTKANDGLIESSYNETQFIVQNRIPVISNITLVQLDDENYTVDWIFTDNDGLYQSGDASGNPMTFELSNYTISVNGVVVRDYQTFLPWMVSVDGSPYFGHITSPETMLHSNDLFVKNNDILDLGYSSGNTMYNWTNDLSSNSLLGSVPFSYDYATTYYNGEYLYLLNKNSTDIELRTYSDGFSLLSTEYLKIPTLPLSDGGLYGYPSRAFVVKNTLWVKFESSTRAYLCQYDMESLEPTQYCTSEQPQVLGFGTDFFGIFRKYNNGGGIYTTFSYSDADMTSNYYYQSSTANFVTRTYIYPAFIGDFNTVYLGIWSGNTSKIIDRRHIVPFSVHQGDVVEVNMTAGDYRDFGLTVSETFTVNNVPIAEGQFNQESYKNYQDITFNITVYDDDLDLIDVLVTWYINDANVSTSLIENNVNGTSFITSLSHTLFDSYDNITIEFVPTDGIVVGDTTQSTVQINYTSDCEDTLDNDGDGLIDYPDDTGCNSFSDTSELGTVQCDDGIDNDGDLGVDYPQDPGCTSSIDDDESTLYIQQFTPSDIPKVVIDNIVGVLASFFGLVTIITMAILYTVTIKKKINR